MSHNLFVQISAPSTEVSIQILAIGSLVLFLVVTLFFLTSLVMRYRHNRYEMKLEAAKEDLYPKIMSYLEGETDIGYFKYYFSGEGVEFVAFKEIIFELLKNIEGEDADKLRRLLQVEQVFNYHKQLLDSWFVYNRVLVYDYINYIRLEDQETIDKIKGDIHHKDQLIAFSAATALMASIDVGTRALALDAILRRNQISRMAILEMLYKYHREEADELDEESDQLRHLIQKTHYPPKNIGILIQGVSEIGYYQLPQFLHDKLKMSRDFWQEPYILSALIEAMGNYFHEEASSQIRAHIFHEARMVRKACVETLGQLPNPENLKALYNMLFDSVLEIRYKAVQSLIDAGDEGKKWLQQAVKYEQTAPSSPWYIESIIKRIEPDYGVLAN